MKVTNESMVTFQNGSDVMTESFRKQIYELLKQSKVVHPIKDKQKRKTIAKTKDLEQILANNEKQNNNPFRVKKVGDNYKYDFVTYTEWEKMMSNLDEGDKEKWEKNAKELRDLIAKIQKRKEQEKRDELGEDVKSENKRKSIKQIISDLVESVSFHQMNMKQISTDYYLYDRMDFLKKYYDLDREVDTYWIDIESLANMIIQIHKYSHIILSDEEGKDIWTNKVIYEKEKDEL